MNRDFILLSIGRVIQILISLVAVRIFTTFLSATEVGNLYLINSVIGFFGLALINPVHMFIYRRLFKWNEDGNLINCLFMFNVYVVVLSILSMPLIYILNSQFGIAKSVDLLSLMVFIALNIYFLTWNQTVLSILNMMNRRSSFVVFTLFTLSLGLILSISLVANVGSTALWWLNGQLVAQGAIAGVAFLYFRRIFAGKLDLNNVFRLANVSSFNSVIIFAFPLCLTNFFTWLQYQSYRMVVEKNVGLEFLGMLGLGLSIASSIATAMESIVQQLYYPGYYREIHAYDTEVRTQAWNKMAQIVLPVYFSLTIMVSCLAPFLVSVLAHKKFAGVFPFIIYGAWVELFRMTTNLLSSIAHAEMQTKYLVKSYLVGSLIAVSCTYFASKWHEYNRLIPVFLVFSGFVTLLVMYYEMKKLTHFKVGIRYIKRSALISAPFALAIPFYGYSRSLPVSLVILSVMGAYFMAVNYRISRGYQTDNSALL